VDVPVRFGGSGISSEKWQDCLLDHLEVVFLNIPSSALSPPPLPFALLISQVENGEQIFEVPASWTEGLARSIEPAHTLFHAATHIGSDLTSSRHIPVQSVQTNLSIMKLNRDAH
jgi:hypothetical protein